MLGDRLQDKMKFYGNPACVDTAKCLFMAAEKGVDIESHYVGSDGSGAAAEAEAISPYGSMPVIRDKNFVVFGAIAIISFLDDKGFGPSLIPRKATTRTLMYQWIHIADRLVQPDVEALIKGEGDADAVSKWFDVLDAHLESKASKDATLRGDFICGVFSVADVYWAALAQGCVLAGSENILESKSNVKNWWGAVKKHDSTSKEPIKAYTVLPTSSDVQNKSLRDIEINA